jgi:Flp pilus assembly pilin Flp
MNHLTSFMQQVKAIWQQQDAVTSVEYALIGSLIAAVMVISVGATGMSLSTFFTSTSNCVTFTVSGTGSFS